MNTDDIFHIFENMAKYDQSYLPFLRTSKYSHLCVITTKYDFIKYKNTNKNSTTYFNSTTSTNTNTTGQKANMPILACNCSVVLLFCCPNDIWKPESPVIRWQMTIWILDQYSKGMTNNMTLTHKKSGIGMFPLFSCPVFGSPLSTVLITVDLDLPF